MTTVARRAGRHEDRWACLLVSGLALAAYVLTLAPSLTFALNGTDGGDLIAAASTLGVPHPPGYPSYTLLAALAERVPIGSPAYRTNLLSALCAAASVGLVFRTARCLLPAHGHSLPVASATALSFAFSSLLWSQAVITEVYALSALFAALVLYLLARWRTRGDARLLSCAAGVLGLGLGNHLSLIFIVPPAAVLLWPERRHWLNRRTLLGSAAFFALGLSVYAYLPLAAAGHPPIAWGDPRTWDRFLWTVTGRLYQPLVFRLPPPLMLERLRAWAALAPDQFGWWGLALAGVGLLTWWKRDRTVALCVTLWAALFFVYAFFYGTADAHVNLLPFVLMVALCWGQGACLSLDLAAPLRAPWRQLALAVILLLPVGSLAQHWRAADLSHDWDAIAYVETTLSGVAPGGLVLTQAEKPTFALWYALYAEHQRPDVTVVNVHLLAFDWYRNQLLVLDPSLSLPGTGTAGSADELARTIILRNYPRRAVYCTDAADVWSDWFDMVPVTNSDLNRIQLKTHWEAPG